MNWLLIASVYFIVGAFQAYYLPLGIESLSFFAILAALAVYFNIIANSNYPKPASVITWVFFFVFMYIAPVIQMADGRFPNTFTPGKTEILTTNVLILMFVIVIMFFEAKKRKPSSEPYIKKVHSVSVDYNNSGMITWLFILSCLSVLYLLSPQARAAYLQAENGKAMGLILKHFVAMIPVSLLAYLLSLEKSTRSKLHNIYFIVSLVLVLIAKNPFNEKRNALGPIYLGIVFGCILTGWVVSNSRFLLLNTVIMFVAFPFMKAFTHNQDGDYFTQASTFDFIRELKGLDFDAWSNIAATVHYVANNGHLFGQQLAATLFFWVPRNIWPSKPDYTGKLIAGYLTENYSMWFENLSNPIISEAYIDFGVIGIIIYAVFISLVVSKLNKLFNTSSYSSFISVFFSYYLIFIFRGALMSAVAYSVGSFLAIVVVPQIIKKIFEATSFRTNNIRINGDKT
ncbi:MAG: O-antigen polysaccharide polymerase Wzy family protein [Clostridia bacterium]|nr:O-antigen polysaccharide polymerase Wzy family protein [Clostridia bacterium]